LAGPSVSAATFHSSAPAWKSASSQVAPKEKPPFEKLMAANRGEIATRIVRAASELGIKTAGIYAHEGRICEVDDFT
jgi:pyruvate carboxylase